MVPVLGRPHRVLPLLESAERATPDALVLFVADPDDGPQLEALEVNGAEFISPGGTYAEKINRAVRETDTPLVFTGADDITFVPGWFERAKSYLTGDVQVVGVTDEVTERNRLGHHAPHFLMTREYALQPTIDGGQGPFCEGYGHMFVDDEFIGTARKRGVIHIASDVRVEHHHYLTGAVVDDTYEKGRATRFKDGRLFKRRRRLWL